MHLFSLYTLQTFDQRYLSYNNGENLQSACYKPGTVYVKLNNLMNHFIWIISFIILYFSLMDYLFIFVP